MSLRSGDADIRLFGEAVMRRLVVYLLASLTMNRLTVTILRFNDFTIKQQATSDKQH